MTLIRKELLALWRDPQARMILFVPLFVDLAVFANAATLDVKNAEIGILNEDEGSASQELLRQVAGSPMFGSILYLHNTQALREAIEMRRVLAVVHIGPSFSRDIYAERPADVQLILDGRRANAAQIVSGYFEAIFGRVSEQTALKAAPPPTPAVISRSWFNPNLEFKWHTVPGLIAQVSLVMSLVITSLAIARERELGTFDQLIVSPFRSHEILIGKAVPPMLVCFIHTTLYVLVSAVMFRIPLRGSVPLLYGSLFFYVTALTGVGLLISAAASTQQQAILGAFAFAVPSVLLSGFATPLENMPSVLQWASLANPLRYFFAIIKGIFLKDVRDVTVIQQTVPLVLITIVTMVGAAWLFRHRRE